MSFVDPNAQLENPLGFLFERPAWQAKGNCVGISNDFFFPTQGQSTNEAKEVCRGCVVRVECLDWALTHHEKFGVWGGLSEKERRRIRTRRRPGRPAGATS